MRSSSLPTVLRRVLISSLAGVSLLSLAGCGASVGPADSSGTDAGTDTMAPVDTYVPPDNIIVDDNYNPPPDVQADAGDCTPRVVTQNPSCSATVTYPCSPPPDIVPGMGITSEVCARECPAGMFGPAFSCWATRDPSNPAGEVTLQCTYCAVGRRTEGFAEPDLFAPGNIVGQFLANNATLEEASVTAFLRLRDELRAFGAPEGLLEALARAADEERDHTRRVGDAARRFGVEPQSARIEPVGDRTLFTIARENAVEGCVRETYGALVAAWQAWRASDPELASLYEHLADDETRHASLSWRLDEWILPQLTEAERAEVERARREAIDGLYRDLATAQDPTLIRVTGLPDTTAARAMLDGLAAQLWSDARAN